MKTIGVFFACILLFSSINSCQKYDDLSDQNPMLVVDVQLIGITPTDANKIYLIYYNSSDWTEQWLVQSTTGTQFFNPVVLSYSSMYLAVFYDLNGNTVPDSGDPCIGYNNAAHSPVVEPLTQIQFLPLEIKQITITLDIAGPVYLP